MISSQLAHLLIDVLNERGAPYSCRAVAHPGDAGESVPFVSRQHRRSAASRERRSAAHLPFHHSQPFTLDLFLQPCYFQPHVERCQRVPVSLSSSLSVPMRQMLISCSCRFSRSVLLTEALCVFVALRLPTCISVCGNSASVVFFHRCCCLQFACPFSPIIVH